MTKTEERDCWEEAYAVQNFDAVVGRLFRGLVHNLNGVLQAFVMQADLMELMFPQAEELLNELEAALPAAGNKEPLQALRALLRSRAEIVVQAQAKVASGKDMLRRVLPLSVFLESLQQGRFTANDIVRSCVEFLSADSFFKHQVVKGIQLDEHLPPLSGFQVEAFEVLLILLEHAIDKLKAAGAPASLDIISALAGDDCLVEVVYSGPANEQAGQERLSAPCPPSAEGVDQMRLVLAGRLATAMGGSLTLSGSAGEHRCSFRFPALHRANDAGQ